jgi:membrane protein DedA with SNARE-associated domain
MHIFELLRRHFAEHGYLTVAVVLLLENAGIPLPGETTLLFAAFLAFSEHRLTLFGIIIVGVIACTIGDNIGYWIGHRGGRPLLEHQRRIFRVSDEHLARGERFFVRYGSFTVFFARFVFGMRIIAGPLAGVLRMPWKKFVLFNFLGAAVWVSVVASLGYFFGSRWQIVTEQLEYVEIGLIGVLLLILAIRRKRLQKVARGE